MTATDPRKLTERLTGYTPGPWKAVDRAHPNDPLNTIAIQGADGLFVSFLVEDPPYADADAALIAAAPDLVDALTAALDRAEKAEAEVARVTNQRDYSRRLADHQKTVIDRINAERDAAWNDAIESAVTLVVGSLEVNRDRVSSAIAALRKGGST